MWKRLTASKQHEPKSDSKVEAAASDPNILAELEVWQAESRPKIGEVLVNLGHITGDELLDALTAQATRGGRLGEILIESGVIDDQKVAAALAEQFDLELADLRNVHPEAEAVDRVGEELARKHTVMPLSIDPEDDRVTIATGEPLDTDAIADLTAHCQRIRLLIGSKSDIEHMLDQHYTVLRSAMEHIRAFELVDAEDEAAIENDTLTVDENAPIVQVVNRILMQGVRARASDIHIEPQLHDLRVRYRIDGALSEAIALPRRMGAPISSRIKVMAELNIVERRRPQDGQFSLSVDGRPIDVRTSVVGTVHGEKIVLRLLDKTRSLIGLDQLGMPARMIEPYLDIVKAPLGMLLCTGPTGSGKTTTLYATLTQVNDPSKNVVTIEDPVEYQFPGVNQMPISESMGVTFADGLRGILRQDPDTILLGEIRDIETARIATQAALTGHFVLSSLHAVDAVAALHRFSDMGIEPFLIASAISGIVGQRLLRRICDDCRVEFVPPVDQITMFEHSKLPMPERWTHGVGCNLCSGTGYSGRVGVYELLRVSDNIRDLIVRKATASEIREVAIDEGMHTMQQEAFRLVSEGMTTVDEVLRSVYAPGMDDAEPEESESTPPAESGQRTKLASIEPGRGPLSSDVDGDIGQTA